MSNKGDMQDMSSIDEMTNVQDTVNAEEPSTLDIPFDIENYRHHIAKQEANIALNEFVYNAEVQEFLAAEVGERDADWLRKILRPPFHPPLKKAKQNKQRNLVTSEPTEHTEHTEYEPGRPSHPEVSFTRMLPPHMMNMKNLGNTFAMQSWFELDNASGLIKHHWVNGITTEPRNLPKKSVENRFGTEIQAVARVPSEIWKCILRQLSPQGIRTIRAVCRTLLAIIDSDDNIFIEARHRMYGKGLFNPPSGLSELQYSVLLNHNRCQRCGHANTRRSLWGYMRKWCARCFELQTHSASTFRKCEQLVEEFGSKKIDQILATLPFEGKDSYGGRAFLGFLEAQEMLNATKTAEKSYRISDFARMVRLIDQVEAVVKRNEEMQDDDPNRVIWAQLYELVSVFVEHLLEIQTDEAQARMFWALRTENIVVGTDQAELWARFRRSKYGLRDVTLLFRANAVNEAIASATYGEIRGEETEEAHNRVKPDALQN